MPRGMQNRKTTQYFCVICGAPTKHRFKRCQRSRYSGPEHLSEDWPTHKTACKPREDNDRPYCKALIFAHNENEPRMVELPYDMMSGQHMIRPRSSQKTTMPQLIDSMFPEVHLSHCIAG
ncbi:hypothetical protein BXZ70DRAFT_954522 [Cristinia sonorae]|uniref:MYND-type domain-containing protein n=1 Tax=Cristinia sonorae TaxID=1940300 RepID=A0A8K0XLN3_9AGAR|nr:hypothetical protein BXZ70DRAFT_954522 [Cristinia sonorae]